MILENILGIQEDVENYLMILHYGAIGAFPIVSCGGQNSCVSFRSGVGIEGETAFLV